MIIIGAGMAGLLAANMLHRHKPVVIERQMELPNNHSAVLRFGTTKVSEALGIPFRKVTLIKTYLPWRNRIADNLAYSRKCNGISRSDRSIARETFSAERWIAPPDLIQKMADAAHQIDFGNTMELKNIQEERCPKISTIPMPFLMQLLEYPSIPEFRSIDGFNIRAKIPACDAFVTLYVPDPAYHFNRISITGDELILEYANVQSSAVVPQAEVNRAMLLLGLEQYHLGASDIELHQQRYSKIQPIDDHERKRFIAWATDNFGIFSLGRFATWRPGLQLDDLPNDISLIKKWIESGNYQMKFHR